MTPWTRDLNFGAAILDLGLWALLIGSRQKDRKLLLVTGALGHSVHWRCDWPGLARYVTDRSWLLAGDFVVLTNLARHLHLVAGISRPDAEPSITSPNQDGHRFAGN